MPEEFIQNQYDYQTVKLESYVKWLKRYHHRTYTSILNGWRFTIEHKNLWWLKMILQSRWWLMMINHIHDIVQDDQMYLERMIQDWTFWKRYFDKSNQTKT